MLRLVRPALVLTLGFTLLTGLAYPLAMTGLARLLFPDQAAGSLVMRHGKVIGSRLIGQSFTAAGYFHGRPSATTGTDAAGRTVDRPYNAGNSGGSNLGPTAKALIERVRAAADTLQRENPGVLVPVDLVTTSASGLDPDITPAAALFQVPRVARARHLPEAQVAALVRREIAGRTLGILGEPRVNVLALNLALDALSRR